MDVGANRSAAVPSDGHPRRNLVRRLIGFGRADDGGSAIELAFVIPILLLFIMGTVEFGRAWWVRNTLQYATEEAARYAMTHVSATVADLQARVAASVAGVDSDDVDVSVTTDIVGSTSFVTIQAEYTFTFLTLISTAFSEPLTLTGRSRVPLIS